MDGVAAVKTMKLRFPGVCVGAEQHFQRASGLTTSRRRRPSGV
jgi:hypothetical protein